MAHTPGGVSGGCAPRTGGTRSTRACSDEGWGWTLARESGEDLLRGRGAAQHSWESTAALLSPGQEERLAGRRPSLLVGGFHLEVSRAAGAAPGPGEALNGARKDTGAGSPSAPRPRRRARPGNARAIGPRRASHLPGLCPGSRKLTVSPAHPAVSGRPAALSAHPGGGVPRAARGSRDPAPATSTAPHPCAPRLLLVAALCPAFAPRSAEAAPDSRDTPEQRDLLAKAQARPQVP